MKVSFAGCSRSLSQICSRVGVIPFWLPLSTHGSSMNEFWHVFENYNYDELCAEISELRKRKDESLEDFIIIFMHLCYRFPLDDRSFVSDLIIYLNFLTNGTNHPEAEEYESCLNATLHVDLYLCENVENVNELVDIDHRDNSFSEEAYVSSNHSTSPSLC
jgi:hypothetical protein